MEVEDNGLVPGKENVIFRIRQTVGMLSRGLQLEQIHDVDKADLHFGKFLVEDGNRSQRFQRRSLAGAGKDNVRFLPLVVAGPFPDANALGAVLDGLWHTQPLWTGMLARDSP